MVGRWPSAAIQPRGSWILFERMLPIRQGVLHKLSRSALESHRRQRRIDATSGSILREMSLWLWLGVAHKTCGNFKRLELCRLSYAVHGVRRQSGDARSLD